MKKLLIYVCCLIGLSIELTASLIPVIENLEEDLTPTFSVGFFYLKIPDELVPLVAETRAFVPSIFENEAIKSQKHGQWGKYDPRIGWQIENIMFEREFIESVYGPHSASIVPMTEAMYQLGVQVIKRSLFAARIPQHLWSEGTGGAVDEFGMCHLNINHYRPEIQFSGLKEHRDFWHVTILYVDQGGLEAKVNGEWVPVPPRPGYFIVNYGQALMTLTNGAINGALHRVVQLTDERYSFGVFLDNAIDYPVVKYHPEKENLEILFPDYKKYADALFSGTYSVNYLSKKEDLQ